MTVPAGFSPGAYNLQVANPNGQGDMRPKGYRACQRRLLDCALDPMFDPTSPLLPGLPIPWRMMLEGDEIFFTPEVRHRAALLLPDLPSDLETRLEPGDGSGRMAIDLYVAPEADQGLVVLVGDDPDEVTRLRDEVREAGECSLSQLDDHHYGDPVLEVSRTPPSWPPHSGVPGAPPDDLFALQPSLRYRYEFAEGELTAARASGAEADLLLEAVGVDKYRCETADTVSFVETRREWCEEMSAAHPGALFDCEP